MNRKRVILIVLVLAMLMAAIIAALVVRSARRPAPAPQSDAASAPAPAYGQRADVVHFANDIANRNHIPAEWVLRTLSSARQMTQIQTLALPPASSQQKKNWTAYRARFVEPQRIRAGLQFWSDNADALQRAEAQYGVPASIIVSVIGMETLYGKQMGNFRVLDALATLAFDFPKDHPRAEQRKQYFLGELEQFLIQTHKTDIAPSTLRGSYSGDMGLPQFMPSSWAEYGVDGNGDGKVNLWSAADASASVANYLQGHDWIAGLPAFFEVSIHSPPDQWSVLLNAGIKPSLTLEEMRLQGVEVPAFNANPATLLSLVELENGESKALQIAGTNNFAALTRYNPSRYYALAVIQLAGEIQKARDAAR